MPAFLIELGGIGEEQFDDLMTSDEGDAPCSKRCGDDHQHGREPDRGDHDDRGGNRPNHFLVLRHATRRCPV